MSNHLVRIQPFLIRWQPQYIINDGPWLQACSSRGQYLSTHEHTANNNNNTTIYYGDVMWQRSPQGACTSDSVECLVSGGCYALPAWQDAACVQPLFAVQWNGTTTWSRFHFLIWESTQSTKPSQLWCKLWPVKTQKQQMDPITCTRSSVYWRLSCFSAISIWY